MIILYKKQCTYYVTFRRVLATDFAKEKLKYYLF